MTSRMRGVGFFNSPPSRSRADVSVLPMGDRMVLVAIRGDFLPPFGPGAGPLHAMQATMMRAGEEWEFCPPTGLVEAPHELPCPAPARALPGEISQYPRRVVGEILRDAEGRLYEKIGPAIRALHRLANGPDGILWEFGPSEIPAPQTDAGVETGRRPAERFWKVPAASAERDASENRAVPSTETPRARPAFKKLFEDPGRSCVAVLGEFKSMLTSQLAHPERLRDSHRLPCYVQVYESLRPQRLDALAEAVLAKGEPRDQCQPLVDAVAQRLALTDLPAIRPHVPRDFRRPPGLVLPAERMFRLILAEDPTRDAVPQQPTAKPVATETPAPATTPRKEIPKQFLNPWEFRLSREEAQYDLNVAATSRSVLRSLFRWLKRGRIRSALRKWQALLCGRALEEQLWEVRLPTRGYSDPLIREWARNTLAQAGYDLQTMLAEWEIYWRRKGV